MSTNITDEDKRTFDALRNPEYGNFALFSAFYEGKPCTVIVTINDDGGDDIKLTPVAILVTDDMLGKLTDHDGNEVAP